MSEDRKPTILIVDDETVVRESLFHWFSEDGYDVDTAPDATEALKHFESRPSDVLLLDIKMPGMDGLELHRRLRGIDPDVAIIIMTAYASVDTAVRALKDGAYDYIVKPFDPDTLTHVIRGALERRRLMRENRSLKDRIDTLSDDGMEEIIGETPQMKQVKGLIRTVAPSDATVLVTGESGTGKELVARAIHRGSPRKHMPLVAVNCAGLAEGLIESELFGHEKGSFTGAEAKRKGKIEIADGGTLFIDEIGDISPKTQVDLLRVLEEKAFTRVGGNHAIKSDFRVIAATNRDLHKRMEEHKFRTDLYYRINVFNIALPPLRERTADIPLLVNHFLEQAANSMGRPRCSVSGEAMARLMAQDWPGNIRELRNALERGMLVQQDGIIRPEDLPLAPEDPHHDGDTLSLEATERRHIQNVLDMMEGNVTKAARSLGIDRVTLYNKIKKYGLKR
jgi:DNA-binding NtrC family response regulator